MIPQLPVENSWFFLITTIVGFSVLIMGRQIFWIFIAGLSFILGLLLSSQFYDAQFDWRVILISSIAAALGALLAYTVQRVAAGIAGFATGWYMTIVLMGYFSLHLGQIGTLIPYIVGIISGILLMRYFDWGVIIASSLAGSAIIVSATNFVRNIELALIIMLALLGIAIQAIWFMQEK
jgi:hypothetical protein